jgi:DNA invertase Pin-like site-specific DNA recombinase
VRAPQGASAEDQLLVQFQGMIAEYERAQILERSRRGKRHRAQAGEVSVLSGAPYGYRYIRKTDEAPAAYEVIDAEARVVQRVYAMYTVEALSIGAIARRLNAEGIERASAPAGTLGGVMSRNSAHRGVACFRQTRGRRFGSAALCAGAAECQPVSAMNVRERRGTEIPVRTGERGESCAPMNFSPRTKYDRGAHHHAGVS